MRHTSAGSLIFCTFLTATTLSQADEIGGGGTPGYLPKFTGTQRVGNSTIFQSPSGNVGIGTIQPLFPLHIFSNNTFPPPGQDFPVALFVETPTSINSVCASCGTIGIEGLASAPSGNVIGVDGVTYSSAGNGVLGNFTSANSDGGGGVIGLTSATSGFSYGARGDALGASGTAVGVFGQSFSPDGYGGFFQSNASAGGIGLTGVSYSTSGFSIGVRGLAVSPTGNGVAVFGVSSSANGTGAIFVNEAGGTILDGRIGPAPTATKVFRVDGTGRVFADGGFQPSGADFAESMSVTGDRAKYSAGDLLAIDPTASRHVALAQQPYSTLVAGIYSTKPGLLGTTRKVDDSAPQTEVPLAVVGIVPCKVTAENGPIQIGDLLVTSSTPGHAMRGTDRSRLVGAVVGKALEPLAIGNGVIQVLVTLQ
jgi:hypothetical protein